MVPFEPLSIDGHIPMRPIERCAPFGERENTPLQALVTLNDPVYVEAAQVLARRIVKKVVTRQQAGLTRGFRLGPSRQPSGSRNRIVWFSFTINHWHVSAKTKRTPSGWRRNHSGPADEKANVVELAAWTVVGNVLLNLDESVMKR